VFKTNSFQVFIGRYYILGVHNWPPNWRNMLVWYNVRRR